jgi:hypothetical protein
MLDILKETKEGDKKNKIDFGGYILHSADYWRSQWEFITDETIKRNLGYQMQYLDFLISLYNSYEIYATIESLIIKNIIVNVNLIIEAILSYSVGYLDKLKGKKQEESISEESDPYRILIGKAYHEHKLISKDLWHTLHELRKQGNSRHFQSEKEWELNKYKIENANDAIDILEEFRVEILEFFSEFNK